MATQDANLGAILPANLGAILPNEAYVYRAFAVYGARRTKGNKVRPRAFHRPSDHADGLSVGTTPEHSVQGLDNNCGYCRVSVEAIHGLPYNLVVRADPLHDGHALIENMPCIDSDNDADRQRAELIAGELARIAELITSEPYNPTPIGAEENPVP
jgi:hypothetical protein